MNNTVLIKDMPWVIFDLDGTLADVGHRLHHIKFESYLKGCEKFGEPVEYDEKTFKRDFEAFNDNCHADKPKFNIIHLNNMFFDSGYNIAIVTGRPETHKDKTVKWLEKHNIQYDKLHMRKATELHRPDADVKADIYDTEFADKLVQFVIDDRQKVVDMWRSKGLTCLQCQKGDY